LQKITTVRNTKVIYSNNELILCWMHQ